MSKLLLHIAAGTGDVQTLKELLAPVVAKDEDDEDEDGDYQPKDWHFKINKRNCMGETPLHIACLSGQVEAAEFLLQNGAKLFPIFVSKHHKLRVLHTAIQATILSSNPEVQKTSVPLTRLLATNSPLLFETDWQDRTDRKSVV